MASAILARMSLPKSVLFGKYAGGEVRGDENLVMLREDDVLGVLLDG